MNQLMEEIRQQPTVVAQLTTEHVAQFARAATAIRQRGIKRVLIAARGTSDNAARYAQYLWGYRQRLPVALATPSLYTVYRTPPRLADDTLVIGVSQSGTSPDIVGVVSDGREQGMLTLAITNAADSPLAETADLVLECHAGAEQAVAATKTYTAQLAVVALLCATWSDDEGMLATLRAVPAAMVDTLDANDPLAEAATRYAAMRSAVIVGRGLNYGTAFEIALKIGELAYVGAMPYSAADFMHGPIAVVEPGFPAILVAPTGETLAEMRALAATLHERGADLLIVSDDAAMLEMARTPLPIAGGLPEWATPLVAALPGQLLGHHLAVAKGYDPVQPRSLNKITKTL